MRLFGGVLATLLSVLCISGARAQTLNFTNDLSQARGPTADPRLLQDRPDTVHFAAGSAVWAVLYVPPAGFVDVNAFSGTPGGGGTIRKTVEMANRSGGWDLVSSQLLKVSTATGVTKSLVVNIVPDARDNSQPFNQLLDMIAAHKRPDPILMRVKIESGDGSGSFSQNGFYLDLANGLGRYGEWLNQRGAAVIAANSEFERQHLGPRSVFVSGYRSLRTDPKFLADVRRWWSDKVPGSPLLSAKVCSSDYIIFRDKIGLVIDRQLCALVTYRSGTSCFVMLRRFSYPRIGRETFANEPVDATYSDQHLNADEGEVLYGGQPNQIQCKASN